jgi:hypothetical protein
MKHLEVSIKTVYGVERIYPMNAAAENLCKLMGKKTFSRNDLDTLKRLGYEIKQVEAIKL